VFCDIAVTSGRCGQVRRCAVGISTFSSLQDLRFFETDRDRTFDIAVVWAVRLVVLEGLDFLLGVFRVLASTVADLDMDPPLAS
jgi:hypothetical protein